jgi:hypothetical protein
MGLKYALPVSMVFIQSPNIFLKDLFTDSSIVVGSSPGFFSMDSLKVLQYSE